MARLLLHCKLLESSAMSRIVSIGSFAARHFVLATLGVAMTSACVLDPGRTFEYVYGTQVIGASIAEIDKEMGPPVSVLMNAGGDKIYAYAVPRNHPEKCTVSYEVVNGRITSMTHVGPSCRQYN